MSNHTPNILAIDTATDVCSVALRLAGADQCISETIPRQHSQRLFGMMRELLPHGNLREQGIDLLAYNHGPGSFTGLRIAASAVQGLAFSNELPVAGVSTLACIAEGVRRRHEVEVGANLQVRLDARIGEYYWANFLISEDSVQRLSGDSVWKEGEASAPEYSDQLVVDLFPQPLDLLNLAQKCWQEKELLDAEQVFPIYVRDEIGWKKLAEQGPQ
jgi:tRNA threonylcarbamoyladenosine biosynthesis protein TsaB